MQDFTGVKIALLHNGRLVMFHRDDVPGLRFAGMWDFPGGGREGDETPVECAVREVEEELSIRIPADSIVFQKRFPAMHDPNIDAYFMVAHLTDEQAEHIILGDEGQGWGYMDISEFYERDDVVPPLKGRLRSYLDQK